MAIFAKHDKPNGGGSGATIIASGTRIQGTIEIDCNLHIDGEFEGTIRSKNLITVGKSGIVKGEVYADKLMVSGHYNGSCECEVVEILPNGHIEGSIVSKELVIERKGFFAGESRMKDEIKEIKSKKEGKEEIKGVI